MEISSQCQLYGWENPTYLARGWREGEGTLGRAAHDFLEVRKKTCMTITQWVVSWSQTNSGVPLLTSSNGPEECSEQEKVVAGFLCCVCKWHGPIHNLMEVGLCVRAKKRGKKGGHIRMSECRRRVVVNHCTLGWIAGSGFSCTPSSLLTLPSAWVRSLGQRESQSQTPAWIASGGG